MRVSPCGLPQLALRRSLPSCRRAPASSIPRRPRRRVEGTPQRRWRMRKPRRHCQAVSSKVLPRPSPCLYPYPRPCQRPPRGRCQGASRDRSTRPTPNRRSIPTRRSRQPWTAPWASIQGSRTPPQQRATSSMEARLGSRAPRPTTLRQRDRSTQIFASTSHDISASRARPVSRRAPPLGCRRSRRLIHVHRARAWKDGSPSNPPVNCRRSTDAPALVHRYPSLSIQTGSAESRSGRIGPVRTRSRRATLVRAGLRCLRPLRPPIQRPLA